ncbi:MAG: transporter, partial [Planctomycetota bacterium]
MNRDCFRIAAWFQLAVVLLLATGCAPTQPFFLNESPQLRHYLDQATAVEYPDVHVDSLPGTRQNLAPLSLTNHEFQYRDMSLEECISIAL